MVDIEPNWINLTYTENGVPVNTYFADHPEMMLGTMAFDDRIKNKIIREAVRLGNLLPENKLASEESASAETPVEYQTSNVNVTSAEIEEYTSPSLSDEDSLFASAPEEREEWIPPDDSELPPDFRPYSSHAF